MHGSGNNSGSRERCRELVKSQRQALAPRRSCRKSQRPSRNARQHVTVRLARPAPSALSSHPHGPRLTGVPQGGRGGRARRTGDPQRSRHARLTISPTCASDMVRPSDTVGRSHRPSYILTFRTVYELHQLQMCGKAATTFLGNPPRRRTRAKGPIPVCAREQGLSCHSMDVRRLWT